MLTRSLRCHTCLAATLAVASLAAADANSVQVPSLPGLNVSQTAAYVPGEIIITFENLPSPAEVDALAGAYSATTVRTMRHAPHPVNDPTGVHPLAKVRIITVPAGFDVPALAAEIQSRLDVKYANPNWLTEIAFEPNDPFYVDNTQYGPQIIDAPAAWDITMGDGSLIVAVADTGFNYSHEDLQGMLWVNPGEIPGNGIDDDNNGYIDDVNGWNTYSGNNTIWDGNSHGSHVSGSIGAITNNGIGMAGMANVTIMPIKVFSDGGGGSWEAIVESLYYAADNGASTYNISGGGGGGTGDLDDAVDYAYNAGLPVVCAAGNYNSSSNFFPAAYTNAIAISGTDRYDDRYGSSNYGSWIDVAAPAVDVYSCENNSSNAYGYKTGTSMACPHACGLTALCLYVDPSLTPDDIRALLRDNADDLGSSGFDIWFGYGRINAARTLQAIDVGCPEDLTGDGYVDQADLGELLGHYGQGAGGDIDGDGDTDQADLGALLGKFNEPC